MTNAEKYLKEGVNAEEFVKAVWGSCYNIPEVEGDRNYKDCYMYGGSVERWLNKPAMPTLTEDERVILRNIAYDSEYKYIYRSLGMLYLSENQTLTCIDRLPGMHHLFRFIKERRRILY